MRVTLRCVVFITDTPPHRHITSQSLHTRCTEHAPKSLHTTRTAQTTRARHATVTPRHIPGTHTTGPPRHSLPRQPLPTPPAIFPVMRRHERAIHMSKGRSLKSPSGCTLWPWENGGRRKLEVKSKLVEKEKKNCEEGWCLTSRRTMDGCCCCCIGLHRFSLNCTLQSKLFGFICEMCGYGYSI